MADFAATNASTAPPPLVQFSERKLAQIAPLDTSFNQPNGEFPMHSHYSNPRRDELFDLRD
jgi:hypothetical protein